MRSTTSSSPHCMRYNKSGFVSWCPLFLQYKHCHFFGFYIDWWMIILYAVWYIISVFPPAYLLQKHSILIESVFLVLLSITSEIIIVREEIRGQTVNTFITFYVIHTFFIYDLYTILWLILYHYSINSQYVFTLIL